MAATGAAGTAVPRRHWVLPHTADAGIAAEGPSLEALFEEAAAAVAELSADINRTGSASPETGGGEASPRGVVAAGPGESTPSGGGVAASAGEVETGTAPDEAPEVTSTRTERLRRSVELSAPDLVGLAFAWLNECIGLVDVAGAIDGCRVFAVEETPEGVRLRASLDLVPFDGVRVRRRADVKSATYHGLAVEPTPGGWRLTAYLDI